MTIEIIGYHSENVKDNKDPLARQARAEAKDIVSKAGGKIKRFDVYRGVIFVDVDTKEASKAIIDRFSTLDGVKAQEIDTLQAILRKSHLKPAVDEKSSKAQG